MNLISDYYNIAVSLYQSGNYKGSLDMLKKILKELPENSEVYLDILIFISVVRLNLGEYKEAVEYSLKVININPTRYEPYYNIALSYQLLSDFSEAVVYYKKVVEIKPDHVDALNNLGLCFTSLNNSLEAIKYFNIAIKSNPSNPQLFNNLANLYYKQNNLSNALECYKHALYLNQNNPDYYFNIGNCLMKMDQFQPAIECFRKVLSFHPDHVESYLNMGKIYSSLLNYDEAIKCYNAAIENDPENAIAFTALGLCFQNINEHEKAFEAFKRAYELNPESDSLKINIAEALAKISNDKDVFEMIEELLSDNTSRIVVYTNLGVSKLSIGLIEEALIYFYKALSINNEIPEIHYNISHIELLKGNFGKGWEEYDWRKKRKEFINRNLPADKELKDQDITGKKVFIYDEQGLGDSLQFIRYLPLLKARGCNIIFECDARLKKLYSQLNFVDILIERADFKAPPFYFDYHLPLLTLAKYFKTDFDSIPSYESYLSADFSSIAKWKDKIVSDKFKIGIVWAGNPNHTGDKKRSTSISFFNELSKMDVQLYSLQKGEPLKQLQNENIINLDALGMNEFTDTAAIISLLDLVITVDTSVAHLAGALGKQVWTLLPYFPDWRWLLNRSDTPWYPSMRLYRQPEPGDWKSVFASVQDNLSLILSQPKV